MKSWRILIYNLCMPTCVMCHSPQYLGKWTVIPKISEWNAREWESLSIVLFLEKDGCLEVSVPQRLISDIENNMINMIKMILVTNKLKNLKVAKWRMNEELWMMKVKCLRMRDEDFKLLRGLADWQTNGWTDICDYRCAFATERELDFEDI